MTDRPVETPDPTDIDVDDPDRGAPDADRRWWRGDRSVLIVAGIVAIGFVLMIRGVLGGVTGDDRIELPDAIESLDPVPDAVQVLSQTRVFVDLAPDFTGELTIDDIEIETVSVAELGSVAIEPGQQVDLPPVTIYEPGNATLTFTPGSGAPIEEFDEGVHEVVLRYWSIEDGPQRARTFTWTFTAF